jgi:sulfite reductase beta subunit-like hemoprotein
MNEITEDQLKKAVSILSEHFDDFLLTTLHKETENIRVVTSNPYAALGLIPSVHRKVQSEIQNREEAQYMIDEYGSELFRRRLEDDDEDTPSDPFGG